GDTGGGDTGGGDTGGGDETKTSSPAQEKAKKRFVFDLTPLLYLDLDFSKKFVNLTPAAKSSDRQLVMDEYRDGFRFLQSRSIDFGVGAVGSWHYTNATGLERFFAAYVGVLPITGSKIFSDRFVQKKADAKKLPEPSIPYLAKDLDAWREGDQLSYFTHGGILFFGGAGVSPVTAGLAYLAEGQWTTTIVKLPEQKVYAKLSKTKLNSLSTSAGTALLVVSLSQFKNSDDMFSFVFDLRTASGALAYEDFLKGNIAAIQKMALTPESGVKQDLSSRGKRIGKLWSMWFGIPIFANVVGSQGTTYEAQHVLDGNDGTHTDVEYGIFMKERKTRLFFKHNNKTQAFFGTSYRQDSPVSGKTQGYFGKMVWNYENDNASDNNLRSNIDNLVTLTGLSQIKTEVPVVGKMNYVGIRFEMTIPQQTTDLLMSFAKNKETFVQIYGYAKALLDETFKGIENPDEMPKDLCNMEGFSANRCPEQYHQATAIALNDMYKSLRKMAKSKDKNSKDFVKAYGIFGRALLFNKFAFQSVMKALGNAPVDMVLNVEGERISKVTRVLRNSTVLK
ncbi:MAG TPA: hypothetical protein DCS07_00185, partial [Bdellovibrionales bacterium]|nr:hypothetical protein [Bdellovibrionales bacterium]